MVVLPPKITFHQGSFEEELVEVLFEEFPVPEVEVAPEVIEAAELEPTVELEPNPVLETTPENCELVLVACWLDKLLNQSSSSSSSQSSRSSSLIDADKLELDNVDDLEIDPGVIELEIDDPEDDDGDPNNKSSNP